MAETHRRPIYLFDRIIMAYCLGMVGVLLLLGRPLPKYLDELLFYAFAAGASWLISRYVDETRSAAHRFVRLLYPAMFFLAFYRMTGGTMFLIFDRFFDAELVAFEKRLFGLDISLFIDRRLLNVPTTEILSLSYWLYYPLLPVYFLWVFLRQDDEILKRSVAAIGLTFFVGYALFFLFPIEGPRWFYAGRFLNEVEGPVFRPLVNFMIRHGAVRGGCMPSTHYAVALVVTLFVGRYYRKWLWVMIPLSTLLGLGTVWGRFHYLSDVVVGGLIALGATLIVWHALPPLGTEKNMMNQRKEAHPYHAS